MALARGGDYFYRPGGQACKTPPSRPARCVTPTGAAQSVDPRTPMRANAMTELPKHDRYDFSPIDERPDYTWPNGTRLAVYFGNNIEEFAFRSGLGDNGAPTPPPTHRTYAVRDYGNRVGMWRLFDLLDDIGAPASHNMNAAVLRYAPKITERIIERGDEIVGHGRTNSERQDGLPEAGEAALIRESTEEIERHWGRRPTGWLSPFLAETDVTPDLLREAGYTYTLNWPFDDQPAWMRTRSGPLLSVPYSVEINDLPVIRNHWHYTPRQFADLIRDQFDEMLEESRRRPLVFCFSLHTFVLGYPFRIRPLREVMKHVVAHRNDIWLTTPGEIAAYCAGLPAGTIPGS
jgi:allantoinase